MRILLGEERYLGPVTRSHRHLHELHAIEAVHCDRWFQHWVAAVEGGWAGPCADRAVDHTARLMAGLAKHVFGFTWSPLQGQGGVRSLVT